MSDNAIFKVCSWAYFEISNHIQCAVLQSSEFAVKRSSGQSSIPGKASPLECHDKESETSIGFSTPVFPVLALKTEISHSSFLYIASLCSPVVH